MKTKKQFGIFRNTDSELSHWFVKLSRHGRRHSFDLGTHVKADAAKRAREIYLSLHANGWEVTLSNFSGGVSSGPPVTICQYIERVGQNLAGKRRSVSDYCQVLRRVAADINGVPKPGRKFESEQFKTAVQRINNLKLSTLTREKILAWRKAFVHAAGDDPLAQRSARTSANSYIRALKALFGKDNLGQDRLELLGLQDWENPVARIKLYEKGDTRFKSTIDPVKLFKDGLAELSQEELKALVLGLACGARRNEIDKLEWSAIDWGKSQLHIGVTNYLKPKSDKGVGDIDLDPEILALFRGWRAKANGEFILESDQKPRLNLTHAHYRCESTFIRLTEWLKSKGMTSRTPIHSLRKMFGSLLCDRYGIWAASTGLRHSDIKITSEHYVAKRASATVGLGSVIAEAGKVVKFADETGKIPQKDLAENAG